MVGPGDLAVAVTQLIKEMQTGRELMRMNKRSLLSIDNLLRSAKSTTK